MAKSKKKSAGAFRGMKLPKGLAWPTAKSGTTSLLTRGRASVGGKKRGKSTKAIDRLMAGLTVKGHRDVPNVGRPCEYCGEYHSKSVHKSHGRGSFKRTHPQGGPGWHDIF